MTVLFGSYATTSTRAPTHASEDTGDSLNRLFDDQATDIKDHIGDKMVTLGGCYISSNNLKLNVIFCMGLSSKLFQFINDAVITLKKTSVREGSDCACQGKSIGRRRGASRRPGTF